MSRPFANPATLESHRDTWIYLATGISALDAIYQTEPPPTLNRRNRLVEKFWPADRFNTSQRKSFQLLSNKSIISVWETQLLSVFSFLN